MYPISKYRYFQTTDIYGRPKVIAVSTFAGRTVRGSAICGDGDTFDIERGKEIAAARCNARVAGKRTARAEAKVAQARDQLLSAKRHYDKMVSYLNDAYEQEQDAQSFVDTLI